jgi:large conductance mechanosensitive channel
MERHVREGTQLWQEFREFVLRGNVVDLAVAVAVGTAFTAVVTAVVKDVITPLVGAIFGSHTFANLSFTINGSRFAYGDLINALIVFGATATIVFFFVVKPMNLLLARRRHDVEPEPAAPPEDVRLLTEIRDLLAAQRHT